MLFKKIRAARRDDDSLVTVRDLIPHSRGPWYCGSCGNPLPLRRTHDAGVYFEHDLEQAEDASLSICGYRLTPAVKTASPFELALNEIVQRNDMMSRTSAVGYYWCALCENEYQGPRKCPQCKEHIYSTEMCHLDRRTMLELNGMLYMHKSSVTERVQVFPYIAHNRSSSQCVKA